MVLLNTIVLDLSVAPALSVSTAVPVNSALARRVTHQSTVNIVTSWIARAYFKKVGVRVEVKYFGILLKMELVLIHEKPSECESGFGAEKQSAVASKPDLDVENQESNPPPAHALTPPTCPSDKELPLMRPFPWPVGIGHLLPPILLLPLIVLLPAPTIKYTLFPLLL
ncbi:hypothetical protein GJAV_G00261010 [Gymnothorax javanicus]|nr:hypothetical protein GJAV_G00261010 [Gymnothorax javanicus]